MNFQRTLNLPRLTYTIILVIIFFIASHITVLALPYHNDVSFAPTTNTSITSLDSGIGLWIFIALIFSFFINRYIHNKENKPDTDATSTTPVHKIDVHKSNEIKTEKHSFMSEKCVID